MILLLYAWSHTLCEGRTSFCTGLTSRKLCRFLLMFLTGFTWLSVLLLFPLSPSSSLCMVFGYISSNIDEVLSINPSANVFVFGDFNVHQKDWQTYSYESDRSGELCCNLKQPYLTVSTRIPDCDSQSPALLDFFLSSDSSVCSAMAFLPLENCDHDVSVTVDFPSNSQWDALFHPIAYDYSCAYCDSLCDHFKEDIFKLSASAGAG